VGSWVLSRIIWGLETRRDLSAVEFGEMTRGSFVETVSVSHRFKVGAYLLLISWRRNLGEVGSLFLV
jgi:hypothetical protein